MKNDRQFFPKNPIRGALAGIFLLAVFSSCIKETLIVVPDAANSPVVFSVRVPVTEQPTSTRALSEADEKYVQSIDVLIFNSSGDLETHISGTDISSESIGVRTFSLAIPEGNYARIAVLANASGMIDALPSGVTTYQDVQQNLIFSLGDKWNTAPGSIGYKPMPMWGEVQDVQITGSTTQFPEIVDLYRMFARINVRVSADNFILNEVILYQPAIQGLLIPEASSWNASDGYSTDASWLNNWTRSSITWSYSNVNTTKNQLVNEIYIPEVKAGQLDDNTQNTFLVLKGKYATDAEDTYYRIDFADYPDEASDPLEEDNVYKPIYMPILRNFTYDITVTDALGSGEITPGEAAAKPPANLRTTKLFRNDYVYDYYVYDNRYFLAVEIRDLIFDTEGGECKLKVFTDNPTGWTAKCSTSSTDPNAGKPQYSWLSVDPDEGPQYGSTINCTVTENTTASPRRAYIHIMTEGQLRAVVEVFQHVRRVHKARIVYGYVGAFWKADQTGERLIRMLRKNDSQTINGDWRADVVIGKDWIKLDTVMSKDPNIEWRSDYAGGIPADMNDPAMDALHQVSGTATFVKSKGTADDIYFRIGLRNTIPVTENRYGLIVFSYNNLTESSLIFVRQGEQADYLMRPEDNNADGTISIEWGGTAAKPRPDAVRYSPYNLTAAEFNSDSPEKSVLIGPRDGTWTSYPSMAGAFFQYAPSINIGMAWNANGSGKLGTGNASGYWNTLSASHETCPPNWRRPTDGIIDGYETTYAIVNSEIRQSLYLEPFDGRISTMAYSKVGDNMIWGYYADGYFDRSAISANTTVNVGSSRVASTGILFYNPYTCASLFFPATGTLSTNSSISDSGMARIWSASANNNSYGLIHMIARTYVGQWNFSRESGLPIRCIHE